MRYVRLVIFLVGGLLISQSPGVADVPPPHCCKKGHTPIDQIIHSIKALIGLP